MPELVRMRGFDRHFFLLVVVNAMLRARANVFELLYEIKRKQWGCPDLTDSGLGVKNPRNPHEDTVIEADSQQSELHRAIQAGGAGVMAQQRPQCGQGRSRAGYYYWIAVRAGEINRVAD